jgi:hypothetical protein
LIHKKAPEDDEKEDEEGDEMEPGGDGHFSLNTKFAKIEFIPIAEAQVKNKKK